MEEASPVFIKIKAEPASIIEQETSICNNGNFFCKYDENAIEALNESEIKPNEFKFAHSICVKVKNEDVEEENGKHNLPKEEIKIKHEILEEDEGFVVKSEAIEHFEEILIKSEPGLCDFRKGIGKEENESLHCVKKEITVNYGTLNKEDLVKDEVEKGVVQNNTNSACGERLALSTDSDHKRFPFHCEQCGKRFALKQSLKNHFATHLKERPFSCENCEKTFASRKQFTNHKRAHRNQGLFQCNLCDRSFNYETVLTRHQLIHSNARPFGCSSCSKTFRRKQHLTEHELIHTGARGRVCDVCGKTFRQKSALARHRPTHFEEAKRDPLFIEHQEIRKNLRPFQCTLCTKKFKRKEHLTQHEHLHTGVKEHICDVCGEAFRQRTSLARHKPTHSKEMVEKTKNLKVDDKSHIVAQ